MKQKHDITIGHKVVGQGQPTFIIAEAGVNHNGDLALARKLVEVAAGAGADAIKFQTFTAELLVTAEAPQAEYQSRNTGKNESQLAMLKRLELPHAWHKELQEYSNALGIIFISTPFSYHDADFLESIDVPAFKISSGDLTDVPYLRHIAKKGKPMIVSTGMANMDEVHEAIEAIHAEGNKDIIVLHSTSNYPPSLSSLNLRAIQTLSQALPLSIGYSNNGSEGYAADIVAVSLGAQVIEKHFTLDKKMEGPDHKASLDPEELRALVLAIRDTEIMLGDGIKDPAPEEHSIAQVARKSVIAAKNIKAGSIIAREDLSTKRPGTGLPPKYIYDMIGKIAQEDIQAGTLITSSHYAA